MSSSCESTGTRTSTASVTPASFRLDGTGLP